MIGQSLIHTGLINDRSVSNMHGLLVIGQSLIHTRAF